MIVLLLGSACKLFAPTPPPPPPPKPQNQPPVINSVTAEKVGNPSNDYQVICKATDADGDTLKYWWSANDGMIKGEGDNITWIAPDIAGNYTVKVMVTDGKGGEATGSVDIAGEVIKPNNPPVIIAFNVTPPEYRPAITVKPGGDKIQIRSSRTATIECIANDPEGDPLNFVWSATGGKIQGAGSEIKWIAPIGSGDYEVMVTVTDIKGGKTQASVEFDAACCGR